MTDEPNSPRRFGPRTRARLLFWGAIVGVAVVAWLVMIRMPGRKYVATPPALSEEETKLRDELRRDVQMLGGTIGERNLFYYEQLQAAASFIETGLSAAGLRVRRDSYTVKGRTCDNIEAELKGSGPEIVVIGAHYDSVYGSPGANDNGSGVAALMALARKFAGKPGLRTLRFVAFVNEEPPYFQSNEMGSFVYVSRCKERNERISGMISLETIGYFSNAPRSQKFPLPALGMFYPSKGNFIAFAANVNSRGLLREVLQVFRKHAAIASEGAALPGSVPGVGWSDQWSFWQHGYPGIMVTDTAPFRYPHYHEATDTPEKLDYDSMARVVAGMQKVIEHLVNK